MAGKKGPISNDAFLKELKTNTRGATKSVSTTLEKLEQKKNLGIVEYEKKHLEFRDIYEMVPAPDDWNLYPSLKLDQPDRYLELKMAIYERGIENPLILWEYNNSLMILAGHNRQEICKEIIEECKDEKGFDEQKYRFPPCIVYDEDEITEVQAKEIIDDTNLNRDFSRLPNKVKIQITMQRMEVYKRRRYAKGERIDQLAKDLGLEKTAIYENLSIYEKVIEPLQEFYYNGQLTRKAVLRLTFFDSDTQQWIYDTYKDKITDSKINALKKNMGRDEIKNIFENESRNLKKITIEVPAERAAEFKKLFSRWLSGEITINENEEKTD